MSEITIPESKRLLQLEKTIQRGKAAFVEVGNALAEIRDSKLYRIEYSTFEDYCREKWGWKRQRAYELIAAAEVVDSLPEECNKNITNDSQAKELAKVDPEKREEVLEKAFYAATLEDRPLTARDIKEAAQDEDEQEEPPHIRTADEVMEEDKPFEPRRDLDLVPVRANIAAMVTNAIHSAPRGELPAFCRFLVDEAERVGRAL